jgi:hypothetical protein
MILLSPLFGHAGQIVTIQPGDTTLRVIDSNGELITTVPRNSDGEISRFKAYGTRQRSR